MQVRFQLFEDDLIEAELAIDEAISILDFQQQPWRIDATVLKEDKRTHNVESSTNYWKPWA